ncbi:MAG: helix-turn-helix domain-containing protein [Selenomonadaceae bacterium]|nr:helix-turn-helix domain-containing protein [Selenomonadaceae bacterium]
MVGDILRRERERQNLTIKDIEQATSIRGLYIEAIEKSENDKLPGEVYTRGFIKNYANFLKLDAESLVRQYRDEVSPVPLTTVEEQAKGEQSKGEQSSDEQSKEEQPSKAAVKSAPMARAERTAMRQSSNDASSNKNSLMAVAAVLVLAIVGGLYYYFTNVEGAELASAPTSPKQAVEQSGEQPKVEQEKPAATNVASAAPTTDGVSLEAKFNDRCWTRVTVDGIVAYEGTAEQGQSLSWTATNQIDVTAGNAGAIEFVENGVNLGVAGAVGDVIDKSFVKK